MIHMYTISADFYLDQDGDLERRSALLEAPGEEVALTWTDVAAIGDLFCLKVFYVSVYQFLYEEACPLKTDMTTIIYFFCLKVFLQPTSSSVWLFVDNHPKRL